MIKAIQKIKNKKGFTLVELIVVIAIIAILTAVIVPLVSRYTAQAQYTTLQNNAATISSSANTVFADANQTGVVTITDLVGEKTSAGTLTIYIGTNKSGTAISTDTAGTSDGVNEKATRKLWTSLNSTLPNGCSFYIKAKSAAVEGVIYSTTTNAWEVASIAKKGDYENAYASGDNAVGVIGIYMKDTADGPGKTSS